MEKIDIVITWVDGNDPNWLAEKKEYESDVPGKAEGNSQNRYRNWGTLRYWFRAVEKNMDWVNRIFFVTWGHVPEWLNTDHKKLKIIKHDDFIPDEFLPTFNSEVIEFFFHKIPSLSETFIYFNDDIFPLRRLSPKHFFHRGLPVDYCHFAPFTPKYKPYHHSLFHNYAILNESFARKGLKMLSFNKIFNIKYALRNNVRNAAFLLLFKPVSSLVHAHLAVAYTKTDYEKAWSLYQQDLLLAAKRKFRDNNGINHLLIRDHRLLQGDFTPGSILGRKFSLDENLDFEKVHRDKRILLVCFNDSDEHIQFDKTKKRLLSFFEHRFHDKSSFELF
jgi:hypothetical protein